MVLFVEFLPGSTVTEDDKEDWYVQYVGSFSYNDCHGHRTVVIYRHDCGLLIYMTETS